MWKLGMDLKRKAYRHNLECISFQVHKCCLLLNLLPFSERLSLQLISIDRSFVCFLKKLFVFFLQFQNVILL